jgi:RecB family exonuclease
MRKLSERSVSRNDHYLPYVRDVLQFLSYDRLMEELEQPGMQTAVKKNPDLAATTMQHLCERAMGNPHLLHDREFRQQMQLLYRYTMEGNNIQPPKDVGQKPVNMEAGIPGEKSRPPVPRPYPGGLGR